MAGHVDRSWAPEMAVFISTPSQPNIAMAASEAVPTPASTMTGTLTVSRMIRCCTDCGFRGRSRSARPAGMTTAAPASSSFAITGSSFV
jgi:hypothetical protein